MEIAMLKEIIEGHFEKPADQKRVLSIVGPFIFGINRNDLGFGGVTHYQKGCRAKIDRDPDFALKYRLLLRELV